MGKQNDAYELAKWFLGHEPHVNEMRHVKVARQTLVGHTLEQVKKAIELRRQQGKCLNIFEAKFVDRKTGKTFLELASQVPPKPREDDPIAWYHWWLSWGEQARDEGQWDGNLPATLEEQLIKRLANDLKYQSGRAGRPDLRPLDLSQKRRREAIPGPVVTRWDNP